MSYSVDYCLSQINGCKRTLMTLREDLTKLENIIRIINESKSIYNESYKDLQTSRDNLYNGFRGNAAHRHYSKMTKIMDYYKNDENSVMVIQRDASEKQNNISQRISKVEGELDYWKYQLEIARTEASND